MTTFFFGSELSKLNPSSSRFLKVKNQSQLERAQTCTDIRLEIDWDQIYTQCQPIS